jgi:phosphoribosylformylglycinamidine cyclo-ligase
MPGFYADGEYDLAGFIVGAVDRERVIDGSTIQPGDVLIGLRSSGLHTNGYSLARAILFDKLGLRVDSALEGVGETVADALLRTHRSYLPIVKPLLAAGLIKGMAHITGGGIPGNLSRILPTGTAAKVNRGTWATPQIFTFLQRAGGVTTDEMFRAFNMGIGLILVCASEQVKEVQTLLSETGEQSVVIGEIERGDQTVELV